LSNELVVAGVHVAGPHRKKPVAEEVDHFDHLASRRNWAVA
jgi:hypothetical protein